MLSSAAAEKNIRLHVQSTVHAERSHPLWDIFSHGAPPGGLALGPRWHQ